jgi:hypothetical protein
MHASYEQSGVNSGAGGEVFEGHTWRSFAIAAAKAQGGGPPASDPPSDLADCTTDAFLCVRKADGAVFAVPRGEPSENAKFEVAGSQVSYLGCFSAGRTICDRKVFVAYWGSPLPESIREAMRRPDGSPVSAEETRARQMYVVDTLRGVVSFLALQRGRPSEVFRAQAWEQFDFDKSDFMLLKTEKGLLACVANPPR